MIVFAAVALVLTGLVTDRTTGQPLSGVAVHAGAMKTKTDTAGRYTLHGLHAGKVTIVLESDDVPPESFDLRLQAAKTRHDFTACSTTLDYSCAPSP